MIPFVISEMTKSFELPLTQPANHCVLHAT